MTIQEVADYLRVSIKSVRRSVDGGALKAYRVGRALRFRREDVEALPQPVVTAVCHEDEIEALINDKTTV